jgi:proline iminopeptidase
MRKLLFLLAAVAGAAALTYRFAVLPWFRTWGVNPADTARSLAGDEIIPGAVTAETRTITIDAPPAAVWPWLVQMGFGRAGWYSYDPIDMSGTSADDILPEHQTLAVGDLMPTHPGGGFLVKELDPGRSLVLYSDTDLVRQQAQAAAADPELATPANIQMTSAIMESTQPVDFAATWAFVLDPLPDGGTKLIERFRVRFGETDKPWTRYTLPVVGFGVFVMMRKQMLGIKQRAEAGSTALKAIA